MKIDQIIKTLEIKEFEININKKRMEDTQKEITKQKNLSISLEKTKLFFIELGKTTQKKIKDFIEETVTFALQSVFGTEYQFVIEFKMKRDQSEVYFFIKHYDCLLEIKEDTGGGGVADLCAFTMQLIVHFLTKPTPPPIVIQDEPFKHVSAKFIPKVAEFVKCISEMLEIQLIMATHSIVFMEYADNIIHLNKPIRKKPKKILLITNSSGE